MIAQLRFLYWLIEIFLLEMLAFPLWGADLIVNVWQNYFSSWCSMGIFVFFYVGIDIILMFVIAFQLEKYQPEPFCEPEELRVYSKEGVDLWYERYRKKTKKNYFDLPFFG